MLKAPLLLPSAAPVHNTANVCPVIGTGVNGRYGKLSAECSKCLQEKSLRYTKSGIRNVVRVRNQRLKNDQQRFDDYLKQRSATLSRRFGMTIDDYRNMHEKQNHRCANPNCDYEALDYTDFETWKKYHYQNTQISLFNRLSTDRSTL